MMRVLFLATHLNAGGITSYLLTLSKELCRRGHGVYVVSSGGEMTSAFRSAGAEPVEMDIKTKSELSPKIYRAVGPVLKLIQDAPIDVLHAHTRVTQVLSSLIRRAPLVTTCHGFFKPRLSRRLFPCWGERVIAISPQVKAHLTNDFRVPENKIRLIPNGIDLEEFSRSSDDVERARRREAFDIPSGAKVIGIIARLSDVKGHSVLLDAIPSVLRFDKNVRFLLVGEGKMEERLKRQADELGIRDVVRFIPSVNRTSEFLDLFDVFVMPSLQEGLGLSVIEAQAAGLPVVASRVGGLPSLIEDGRTGILVESGHPEDLARGLIHVLQNSSLAREMGTRARAFVRENFSAGKMCEETLKVYEEVINNPMTAI